MCVRTKASRIGEQDQRRGQRGEQADDQQAQLPQMPRREPHRNGSVPNCTPSSVPSTTPSSTRTYSGQRQGFFDRDLARRTLASLTRIVSRNALQLELVQCRLKSPRSEPHAACGLAATFTACSML